MTKTLLTIAIAVSAIAGAVLASPSHRDVPTRTDLALMNLTPTRDVARPIAARDFVPDKTPTSFTYALPAPGMGAVLGYRNSADPHPVQSYEVNQATALGFSQPSASVGAGLAYRF